MCVCVDRVVRSNRAKIVLVIVLTDKMRKKKYIDETGNLRI